MVIVCKHSPENGFDSAAQMRAVYRRSVIYYITYKTARRFSNGERSNIFDLKHRGYKDYNCFSCNWLCCFFTLFPL